MSEEFIKVTDTQTHRQTELLPELLVGAKNEKQVTIEEVIVSQERCKAKTVKNSTIKYVHKCLKHVDKLEAEISKIKKNAEDLGTTLRTKCNDFCNRLAEIEVNEELSQSAAAYFVCCVCLHCDQTR